jgi:hypothetical protein
MTRHWIVLVRILIIVIFLLCLGYGCRLLAVIHEAEEQREAISEIKNKGAEVRYAYEYMREVPKPSATLTSIFGLDFCANVTDVHFPKGTADNSQLITVSKLKKIESLYLGDNPITDKGLKYVATLKDITELSLCGTNISDAGMKYLSRLSNLYYLDIDRTNITDDGLESLEENDKLGFLSVCGTHVTESGLGKLVRLPKLKILRVTVGGKKGINTENLKRLLPKCFISGINEKDETVISITPDIY